METCPLCYEDVPSDDKFEVHGCLHRFCVNCIREHVITTLQRWKPATCPASGCNSELEAEDCEGFLGPGHLATMTKRKRESMIKFSDRVYCQEPTCNALMSKQSLLEYTGSFFVGAEQSGTRKCMECGFCFCINCQIGWHCNMTCEEYQKTEAYQTSHKAMFMSQAEREGWQRCRECNDMIHLVDGCKHITCRYFFFFYFVHDIAFVMIVCVGRLLLILVLIICLFFCTESANSSSVTPVVLSGETKKRRVTALSGINLYSSQLVGIKSCNMILIRCFNILDKTNTLIFGTNDNNVHFI